MEDKIVLDQVEASLEGIVEKYKAEFYPFEVRESGGGWQFLTKKDYHKTVAQLNGDKFLKRLSTAALETLSIIAYKQPVTKAEIEGIRGVSSDYAIQKLLEKELIVITGRNEKLPGHPLVYATSKNCMDYFGLNSAEDLPKLKEVFDETMVNATIVNEGNSNPVEDLPTEESAEETEENSTLIVAENGELIEGEQDIESETGTDSEAEDLESDEDQLDEEADDEILNGESGEGSEEEPGTEEETTIEETEEESDETEEGEEASEEDGDEEEGDDEENEDEDEDGEDEDDEDEEEDGDDEDEEDEDGEDDDQEDADEEGDENEEDKKSNN